MSGKARSGEADGSPESPAHGILQHRRRTARRESLAMKRSLRFFVLLFLAAPLPALAAEPAWWTQQKQQCGLSSGLAYNTWVAQGSQCNAGGTSSGGFSPEQELGKMIGQALGEAIGEALRGNPEAEARRKAEAEAAQRRLTEELRRREEERKDRLLGGMIGVDDSPPLGLMGIDSGPGLSLMTEDQVETVPSWDRYREWEEYKRNVLRYQERVTKNRPGNRENQLWCQGHIPLSSGPNTVYWESRCNPTGEVKTIESAPLAAKVEKIPPRPVALASPVIKTPAIAGIRDDVELKAASQGGFDSNGLILGTIESVPESPEFSLGAAAPAATTVEWNDSAEPAASQVEAVWNAPASASSSRGAAPDNLQDAVEGSEALPPGAAPATAITTGVERNLQVSQTKPPLSVERQGISNNPGLSTVPFTAKGTTLTSSRKSAAEIQVEALSCAVSELQGLASGRGEEGASLRAEVDTFLLNLRAALKQPCSGQSGTEKIETLALSTLSHGATETEDHLEGNILVIRNETSCEVHLDVQHASSQKRDAFGIAVPGGNEGQSLIQIDKNGKILAAETPTAVAACLKRLSIAGP